MGLRNMSERIERLGGCMAIETRQGKGACVRFACDLETAIPAAMEEWDG